MAFPVPKDEFLTKLPTTDHQRQSGEATVSAFGYQATKLMNTTVNPFHEPHRYALMRGMSLDGGAPVSENVSLHEIRRRYIYLGTSPSDKDDYGRCSACSRPLVEGQDHVYHSSASRPVESDRMWIDICSACHDAIVANRAT